MSQAHTNGQMVPLKPLSEIDFKILNSCMKVPSLIHLIMVICSSIIHNKQLSYLERENEIVK